MAERDPMRRRVLIVLGICGGLLIYHLIADRLTPYTNQAYVQAFVVDIAPEVAGAVVEVSVRDNQRVKAGEKLFRVDPVRFEIAAARAEAALAQAGQTIGASTSQLGSAQARVTSAESNLSIVREQSARIIELASKGMMSQSAKDTASNNLQKAESEVARSRAEL